MIPKRLSIKLFVEDPSAVNLPDVMPVFQRWIQEHTVEGLLIDVIDYKHVPDGPGIILIADEGDYGLDMGNGRPGLKYVRKRHSFESLAELLSESFRLAFTAGQKLGEEPTLEDLNISVNELEIAFLDRLNTPNTADTFDAASEDINAFLQQVFGDTETSVVQVDNDRREPLTIRVAIPEASIEQIQANLPQVAAV